MNTFETQVDFQNRRAIIPEGDDVRITLTTVQDLAAVVVKAVEYEGEWPINGSVQGCEISMLELVRLGEEVRGESFRSLRSLLLTSQRIGGSFTVEKLRIDDLKAGLVKTTWLPKVDHPAIPAEQANAFAESFLAGITLGIAAGALKVSDEWNRLLPDLKFTQPRQLLTEAWKAKP